MKTVVDNVCAALLLVLAVQVRAGDLLQGTIGKYPVVMEIEAGSDGEYMGSYFYKKYKQDMLLEGTMKDKLLTLYTLGTQDTFRLRTGGAGYTGFYTNAKGLKLPVTLTAVKPADVPQPAAGMQFMRSWSDYSKLRMADLQPVADKKETRGGRFVLQWYTEPVSKLSYFTVAAGYPDAVMKKMNSSITADFYQNAEAYFSCDGGNGSSGYEGLEVKPELVSERFVSYSTSSSWYCNRAAHPDFGTSGTTFDAQTGQQLTLEDVFWLGKGTKPKYRSDEWYTYRSEVFAPEVVKLLTRLYPNEMKKPTSEDDYCDYTSPEVWSFSGWYLTDKGLLLGAYFYRAARSCDDPGWSVIPYPVLKKYNPAMFGK